MAKFPYRVHKELMRAVWAALRTACISEDVAPKVLRNVGPTATKFGLIFPSRAEGLAFQEACDRNPLEIPQADGRPAIRLWVGPPHDDGEKARGWLFSKAYTALNTGGR